MRFAFSPHMERAVHHSSAWVCDGPIVQAVVGIAWGQVVLLVDATVGIVVLQCVGKRKVPPEPEMEPEMEPLQEKRVEQVKK